MSLDDITDRGGLAINTLNSPNPFLELFVGTLILVFIIFLHGMGIRTINRRFNNSWVKVDVHMPMWRIDLILAVAIGSLTALHLFETLVWALPIYFAGLIPELRNSYYFVLQSYTTLGEGNIALPEKWRMLGPIIAMSGLFTFGWTASVLVSIMTELGKFERDRAKKGEE